MSDDDATRPIPREPATERLGTAPDTVEPAEPAEPAQPSRARRMTWLWVAIGVLALAVVALLVLLFMRPAATPAVDATPTPTATEASSGPAEPAPDATTEPAPPAAPVFTSFSAEPTTADCSGGAASVPLVFSWSSEGATEAWIGVGTTDAQAAPYEAVPTSMAGYANLSFQCSEESQVYTVTISGPAGVVHNSVTIVRG